MAAEPLFQIEVTPIPDLDRASAIHVRGRLTHREATAIRVALIREVTRAGSRRIVVDLSGIDRVDTAGAAVLVEALGLGVARGIRLVLCSPSESVLSMFRLGGFEEILQLCCSGPDEARRRLGS
jgi:anti-anti-sigma factor